MGPSSVELIEHRLKIVEETVDKIVEELEAMKKDSGNIYTEIKLIQNDTKHTKNSIDDIKKSIETLTKDRFDDHYEKPLSIRKKLEETILMLFKTIAYGGLIVYVLARLFPMINW